MGYKAGGDLGATAVLLEAASGSDSRPFDHILMACGSGGSAAGVAIGAHLSGMDASVHAVGVQLTPESFYNEITSIGSALGMTGVAADWLRVHAGAGSGYGNSTREELDFISSVCF